MRDPSRIPQVMHSLKALWIKNPDMRLGQLIGNILSMKDPDRHELFLNLFHMEDDELLRLFASWDKRFD